MDSQIISFLLILQFTFSRVHTNSFVEILNRSKRASAADVQSFDYSDCTVITQNCDHLQDNIELLSCASVTIKSRRKQLSNKCNNKVWHNVAMLMDGNFINKILIKPCLGEPVIKQCLSNPNSPKLLHCLFQNKVNIQNGLCLSLLEQIETILFDDWQLVQNFISKCRKDININICGRMNIAPGALSQTETLKCLAGLETNLNLECQKEIDYLRSIKYEELESDKVVFAVCNSLQRKYCLEEAAESTLLFKCMYRHRFESGISPICREHMFLHQKLIAHNYKASRSLAKACKDDIRNYHCRKGVSDDKDVRLAQILLCLESAQQKNSEISIDCQNEMRYHRKMLMEDYHLSPELMQNCANEISTACKGVEAKGKTIHCLMEHARFRKKKDHHLSNECLQSLGMVIDEANPGEDWRVDPILRNACQSVVNKACSDLVGGEGRVMSCLMEKLGSALMTEECETALIQISYFISRNFRLDPLLFKACKDDAINLCNARDYWMNGFDSGEIHKDPLILPCLYNHAYNREGSSANLTPACVQQVKRVMSQRAMSVDLLPEIEDNCIDDLGNLCFDKTGKGEEILCLQTNLEHLAPKCKAVVTNFTETQSGHIELNPVVNINCQKIIQKQCLSQYNDKGEDDVMECLISHKNDPEVKPDLKCRAAIEHYQLISLKNYRFTNKFKNSCKSYVQRFCSTAQTKSQVVGCLSEIVRNDTIMDKKHSIKKECRAQIRSQLFQQKENIDLSPELKKACTKDIERFCHNIPHGQSAVIECLQTAKGNLTDVCKKAIFTLRKEEFLDNAVDYNLVTTCNEMIGLYCTNTDKTKILDCLKGQKQRPNFDEKCKLIVVNRMIEQNLDYRFNPKLQSQCKPDIRKFCTHIIAREPQNMELEGKVLNCLKAKFRESMLSKSCEDELAEILKEQALNYRLDPLLSRLCETEIITLCSHVDRSITNANGEVEECLKNALLQHKIITEGCKQEVVQIIQETEIDIGADPLLEKACAIDLLRYCRQLDKGNGRHLKCLKIILNDSARDLEPDCQKELSNRLEMYKLVAAVQVPENINDIYVQVSASPARRYFLVVAMSLIGMIFIIGMFCGRMTRRAMYMKQK